MRRIGPSLAAAVLLGLLGALRAYPAGAPEGIAAGNRLYESGKYREAAEAYARLGDQLLSRQAAGEDAATALFNRGAALYRLGDYARARDSFEQAAVKTRVLEAEGKATYNIGNCYYREAEASIARGNLQEAAGALEAGIAAYRRSLEIAPDRHAAATNLEVARTILKGVRDELAKYGDIQDLQREIVETLKRLIAGQSDLIRATGESGTDTASLLAGQTDLQLETRALVGRFDTLLQRLERLQGTGQQANPYGEARRHVQSSDSHQGRAVAALETGDRVKAAPPQSSSLQELEKALEILTPPQREDRSQQGQGENESGQSPETPPGAQSQKQGSENPQPSEPQGSQGDQKAEQGSGSDGAGGDSGGPGLAERADDILQEEGDKRRAADALSRSGHTPVDKDW